jgi:hypothetical protein
MDPTRCTNPRFRIDPPNQHAEILGNCLELMNQRLEQNMCGLPDGVVNSEVFDLKERIEKHIDKALQYACTSWHKHLIFATQTQILKLTPVLHRFLEEKFLFWLEILSVLGIVREAVDALEATANRLEVRSLSLTDVLNQFTQVGFRCRKLSTLPGITPVSSSHFSTSSAPLHRTFITPHSLYPPERQWSAKCTNNTRVRLRGLCTGLQHRGNQLLPPFTLDIQKSLTAAGSRGHHAAGLLRSPDPER